MKIAYCPYCRNVNRLDDCEWGLTVQCEGPRCEKFFPTAHLVTGPSPVVPEPPVVVLPPAPIRRFGFPNPAAPAPVPDDPPLLTGPHFCQICAGEVHDGDSRRGFGERRHTVLHTIERGRRTVVLDNCRTDVYATVYHCPGCRTLLESPARQWGQLVTCPVERCQESFAAPFDDLVHRRAGDAREGEAFEFECPVGCGEVLTCDTLRGGKPTTGTSVACPRCRHVVAIPASGARVCVG